MQKINKRVTASMVALLLVSGAGLQGAAFAQHGSSELGDGTDSHHSGRAESHDITETSSSSTTAAETETETQQTNTLVEQFRDKGRAKVETKVQEHSQAERQKSCDARKGALTRRMNNAVTAAQRHKEVFDKIYTRVKSFHDSKQLNVTNYDTLKSAVDTAQADSAAKIAALKALDVNVDCTQVDSLTNNVSSFREAVSSTRDSLKSYRKALVSLVTALKGASSSTDKTSNTDDASSTNSTTTQ
jgi:hypothetical protein